MSIVLSKSILIASEPFEEDSFGPLIGYHTIFRTGAAAVTASADTIGGEHENAWKEGLTYDFWRPGSAGEHWLKVQLPGLQSVNYAGIAAHDMHQRGCSVKVQYSTDGGSAWIDASDEFLPANSTPILIVFDTVNEGLFRVLFNSAEPINIGAVYLGELLEIPTPIEPGWTPPYLARSLRAQTTESERGAFLGRSIISEGAMLDLSLRGLTLEWLRETWEPALRQIENYPFFFCARDFESANGISEQEVLYAWTVEQPTSGYESGVSGRLTLRAKGIVS